MRLRKFGCASLAIRESCTWHGESRPRRIAAHPLRDADVVNESGDWLRRGDVVIADETGGGAGERA